MNKQGKSRMKAGGVLAVMLGVVLLLGLIGGGAYLFTKQSAVGGTININPASCGDSTGVLTLTAIDASQLGTTIATPSITCGVSGGSVTTAVTSGTTAFAIGAKLDCLISKDGYIDEEYQNTMSCGGISDSQKMYKSGATNPTITIKDLDTSTTALTNNIAGGAVNVSDLSAGEVKTLEVKLKGTALESSGNGIYVIEFPAGSNANITAGNQGVTLGNLQHVAVPIVYTSNNAGSRVDAFSVPAVVGSSTKAYDLTFSLQASKDLSGGVYTVWYNKQAFVDTDGVVKVGVENSDGTAEYENTQSYNFLINNA